MYKRQYLESLPFLHVSDELETVLVHGGLYPEIELWQQIPHAMIRAQLIHTQRPIGDIRWWETDKEGRSEESNRAEGWVRWYEVYDHPYLCVYGHSVFKEPYYHVNKVGGRSLGIDTGCVFGGTLTAVVLPEMKFISVPACREYVPYRLRGQIG